MLNVGKVFSFLIALAQLCLPVFSIDQTRKIKRRIYRWKHREVINEIRRQWYGRNQEHWRELRVRYKKRHPEVVRTGQQRYAKRHPDRVKEAIRRWQKNHYERVRENQKQWTKNNRERDNEVHRRYKHKHPEMVRRINNRHRKLGFIELNQYFEGSEGHHVDKVHVVYIPKALHESIYHCVWNGHGMAKINALVFEWLSQESKTAPLLEVATS